MLGVLAMSEDATQWYLKQLESTEITVFNTDFERINALLPSPSDQIIKLLKSYLNQVTKVDKLLIPNITIHNTIDCILATEHFPFTIIHPVDLLIKELKNITCKKVLLTGTIHTMQPGYISEKLNEAGIEVTFPNSKEIMEIDTLRKEVYRKRAKEKQIQAFHQLLNSYTKNITVVLACTELSMINKVAAKNILDMAQIQINNCQKKTSQ